MTQRTSRGHLDAICRRLKRTASVADLTAYLRSADYTKADAGLSAAHRVAAALRIARIWARLDAKAPIPPPLSMRVRWTPERVALLKRLADAGKSDEDIAREMAIPFRSAQRARSEYERCKRNAAKGVQEARIWPRMGVATAEATGGAAGLSGVS